jgi:uncharacterized membrane protein YeaQ/YmgE (transglycosylase-associated protein family)
MPQARAGAACSDWHTRASFRAEENDDQMSDTPGAGTHSSALARIVFDSQPDPQGQGALELPIVAWIVSGLIAGYVANRRVNEQAEGLLLDIALGIAGAIIGGCFSFARMGAAGATGFNLYSLFAAWIGAVAVLVLYHGVFGRRPPWGPSLSTAERASSRSTSRE